MHTCFPKAVTETVNGNKTQSSHGVRDKTGLESLGASIVEHSMATEDWLIVKEEETAE